MMILVSEPISNCPSRVIHRILHRPQPIGPLPDRLFWFVRRRVTVATVGTASCTTAPPADPLPQAAVEQNQNASGFVCI